MKDYNFLTDLINKEDDEFFSVYLNKHNTIFFKRFILEYRNLNKLNKKRILLYKKPYGIHSSNDEDL